MFFYLFINIVRCTVYIYDILHALIDKFIQRMYALLLQFHDVITEKDLQIN